MRTDDPFRRAVAETVSAAREASGRSVLSLANAIDMHPMTLTRRLKGLTSFDVDELRMIAAELGFSLPQLFADAEQRAA